MRQADGSHFMGVKCPGCDADNVLVYGNGARPRQFGCHACGKAWPIPQHMQALGANRHTRRALEAQKRRAGMREREAAAKKIVEAAPAVVSEPPLPLELEGDDAPKAEG